MVSWPVPASVQVFALLPANHVARRWRGVACACGVRVGVPFSLALRYRVEFA